MNHEIISGGGELLVRVEPLWYLLNDHLISCSTGFRDHYLKKTFEQRMAPIRRRVGCGKIMVWLAVDGDRDIGYCIASLTREGEGWIDSIFVDEGYRGHGLGGKLLGSAIAWLDGAGAICKRLTVTPGNDDIMGFYERYGFRPLKIVMESEDRSFDSRIK